MFKKITLENFKGFSFEQMIQIKPITLIYGANSSGKSSILQSLLLLKQTLEQSNDKNAILLSKGKYVDLGNYNEFINAHDINKNLKIKLDLPSIYDGFLYSTILNKIKGTKINIAIEIIFSQKKVLEIEKYNVYINNDFFISLEKTLEEDIHIIDYKYNRNVFRHKNEGNKLNYRFSKINFNNEYYQKILTKIILEFPLKLKKEHFRVGLLKYKDENSYEEYLKLKKYILNRDLKAIDQSLNHYYEKYLFNFTNFIPNICKIKESGDIGVFENLNSSKKTLIPKLERLFDFTSYIISDILDKIYYLGPLRKNPERYYVFSGNTSNYVGKTGLESPDILFDNDNKILSKTNKWLKKFTNYIVKPTNMSRKSNTTGSQNVYSLRLIDEVTNMNVNITDVGFGISQIMPIIVQSFLSENNIILIEEPEIHIHPKLQAELGSLFAEASEKNIFLIETHSENLLLRIKKLIRNKILDKNIVSIIYVDKDDTGSVCYPIRLDNNGDFIDKWPNGFFEEDIEELF